MQFNVIFMSVIKGCAFFGRKSESVRKKQAKLLKMCRWRWHRRRHKRKHYLGRRFCRIKQWYRKNVSNKIIEVDTRNIRILKNQSLY